MISPALAVPKRVSAFVPPLCVDANPPPAPRGWKWKKLAPDLARLESGHTPSRRHPEWWGGDVPWVALPDIRDLDGKVAYDTAEHINAQGLENSSARLLPERTVVLSRTASVGFVTIMGRPMATSQDFVNWICGPDLDPTFLALLLRASRRYIRSLASGAVHKTVYVPTVKRFKVCVPDIDEQRGIAGALTRQFKVAEDLQTALRAQLEAAEALPSALLRAAFGGADGAR